METCCCLNRAHVAWHGKQVRSGLNLEYFSLGWMSVEVVGFIVAGLIIGKSFALFAFAGDSVVEMISAYAVMTYMRGLSRKTKFSKVLESERTEKITSALLILLVPTIAIAAIYSHFAGIEPEASLLELR